MRYFITGGCGFIGTNFAEKLLARGDEVILFDNLSRKGTQENKQYLVSKFPQVTFVHGDVRTDHQLLQQYIEQVDMVFHLAGQVAVTTSVVNPVEDFDINARGTLNVLEAIRTSQKKPGIIYASTNKVYGGMEHIKIHLVNKRYEYLKLPKGISETELLDFHSPYGCSKGTADQYVRDYARIYGLKTVVMRQSCIYGTRQFGIEDQGWVAWFVIAALLGIKITLYGDGMQVRDILFVDDLFDAWDSAAKQINTVTGQIFNVGGGTKNTLTLLELVAVIEKFIQKKVSYTFADERPGDQKVFVSDIRKIHKVLNWAPRTAPTNGVQQLLQWATVNKKMLSLLFE